MMFTKYFIRFCKVLENRCYHLYMFEDETKIPVEKRADAYSYNNGLAAF